MAVEAFKSVQLGDDYRAYPVDDHGKLRYQYFNLAATSVAGDANTTIDLCDLPPGRVRLLPNLSRITTSAFGAGRTLDVGHLAYDEKEIGDADQVEAADPDAFIDGMDVSAAVNAAAFSTVLKFDIFSKAGVRVQATVLGGTIPQGATMSGLLAYLYE